MGHPSKKQIRNVNIKQNGFSHKKKKINKYSHKRLQEYIDFLKTNNPYSKAYYVAVQRFNNFSEKINIIPINLTRGI